MRTTLDLNPELLKRVVEETGETSKGKAVDKAMEEFLRRLAIERLFAARGTFNIRRREEWHQQDLELELEHRRRR